MAKRTKTVSTEARETGLAARPAPNEFAGMPVDARAAAAVERIREHWVGATNNILGIGRVIVNACYDGDDAAALGDDSERNELLRQVTRSLGTLEGGPDKGVLSVARRIVAFMGVSRSHFFKVLPYSHKRTLVQLADQKQISDGAKRAVEFGWTVEQTQRFVDETRKSEGKPTQRRGAKLGTARRAVKQLKDAGDEKSIERIGSEYVKLDPRAREAIRAEAEDASNALARLRRRLAELERGLQKNGPG